MDNIKLKFSQQNISRAKNRGTKSWPSEITKFDVYNIGQKQNWKCAITGDELEFVRGGGKWQNKWCNPQSCTIDRIDPTKGYTVLLDRINKYVYNDLYRILKMENRIVKT